METERNSLTFREKKRSLHVSNFTNQMCKLLKKKVQTGWSRQTTHSIILILLSALSMFKSQAVILMAEWALRAAWRSAKPMMQGGVAGGVATGGGYTKVLSAKKPHMGWIHSSAHGPVPQVAPSGPQWPPVAPSPARDVCYTSTGEASCRRRPITCPVHWVIAPPTSSYWTTHNQTSWTRKSKIPGINKT